MPPVKPSVHRLRIAQYLLGQEVGARCYPECVSRRNFNEVESLTVQWIGYHWEVFKGILIDDEDRRIMPQGPLPDRMEIGKVMTGEYEL